MLDSFKSRLDLSYLINYNAGIYTPKCSFWHVASQSGLDTPIVKIFEFISISIGSRVISWTAQSAWRKLKRDSIPRKDGQNLNIHRPWKMLNGYIGTLYRKYLRDGSMFGRLLIQLLNWFSNWFGKDEYFCSWTSGVESDKLSENLQKKDGGNQVIRVPSEEIAKNYVTKLVKLSESSTLQFCSQTRKLKESFK
ncbi:unnamed protein product [Caenorhabditis angaria]|uniref:Uncharacterized protein n=1 Tax=Caenorhabditis angaria TaxID=860376 RepID=A0A9P1I4C6_9PELO|nr:unnamed protein product [Caenorhabditis angaria]